MFTQEEIDMLLRGLDCIEKAESQAKLMAGMVGALMCRDDSQREKFMADQEKAELAQKEKFRQVMKQIIKLKAKLLDVEPICAANRVAVE